MDRLFLKIEEKEDKVRFIKPNTAAEDFPDNSIQTAKYNVFTFIPYNLC